MEDRTVAYWSLLVAIVALVAMLVGFSYYGNDVGLWNDNTETHEGFESRLVLLEAEPVVLVDDEETSSEVTENTTEDPYTLTKSEYEDEQDEAMALELALDSVDSRDFKRALFDALVDFNVTIDNYKDITKVSYETDVDVDEGMVEFDRVKVYFYIDDDDDETYKARLNDFFVVVDDLDYDDDYDDAEVDESYLDLLVVNKVYEVD